ncbi:MAG: UDP-N-acetylglucosamine 2-epimerase (non-hydrolyzing) [Bacteriovoracaceae bacterium]|nr:UDP-N-acetylglucosamine 2-epimerase (non-hydrolyzing) [Bacteriovoracaceae bacterium]
MRAHLCTIFGTRPELIKLSPLIPLLDKHFKHTLISSGQHYSDEMYPATLLSLNIRKPDWELKFDLTLAKPLQIAESFKKMFELVAKIRPSFIIVQGDTHSTVLGALVAKSLEIPFLHLEAGARSFDQRMPEEINRKIVDHLAYANQPFSKSSLNHLKAEKLKQKKFLLPNTGLEAIHFHREKIKKANTFQKKAQDAILITIHRNTNVDDYEKFRKILNKLLRINKEHKLFFITHPRARPSILKFEKENNFTFESSGPLPYLEFLNSLYHCKLIISDSGGVTDEAHYLNKKLIILRENTEYPEHLKPGIVELIPPTKLNLNSVNKILKQKITKKFKYRSHQKLYLKMIYWIINDLFKNKK